MAQHLGLRRVHSHSTDVARASKDLLVAAERDAGEIVAAARADVQRTILKAQQELLALNAQVRTTIERLEGCETSSQRRAEGGRPAAAVVLSDARAQLDALLIEPHAMGVVVTHPAAHAPAAPAPPALSPYEMDNARVRVKVPAGAARGLKAVPTAAIVLASSLFLGAWAWTHGWLPKVGAAFPRPATQQASAADGEREPSAEATGMTGRSSAVKDSSDHRPGRGSAPERAQVPAPASPALPRGLPAVENTSPAARQELLAAAERWLEAYYLQDTGKMAALSTATVTLSDERTADERLPSGLAGVRRTLSDPTVQVFGSDAILTAKITERSESGGRESSGFVSQMWTRRAGVWQVTDVRIVSAAAVARAFRRSAADGKW